MTSGWVERRDATAAALVERTTGFGLGVLLVVSSLGEGGAAPGSMLIWHALLVALLLWVLASARGTILPGAPSRIVLIPLVVFLGLFVLGTLRASYAYAALATTIELGCCLGAMWVATRVGARGVQRLALPLLGGAAAQGGYMLYQRWAEGTARPPGTFLIPNHASLWLVAVALLVVGASPAGESRALSWRRWLLLAPAVAAVLLVGSRGSILGVVAGAGCLLWLRRKVVSRPMRRAICVAAVIALSLFGWRQFERNEDYDPYRYHRVKIWQASASLLKEHPWWGSGPGQFATASANLRFSDGEGPLRFDRGFSTTHSDLLRLPVEFGLPAALAAWLAALAVAALVTRRLRTGAIAPTTDGAVAALIAIGAQATVDNPSTWPAVYLLASALAGIVISEPPSRRRTSAASARLALATLLVGTFAIADVAPFLAWRAARALPRGSLDSEDRARLESALRHNPLHPEYRLRLAEHLASGGAPPTLESYAAAREAAESAVRLHPAAARYRRGAARVEALGCRALFPNVACRERVARRFAEAESRDRTDPFLPAGLAAFLLDTGDTAGARRAAQRALTLEPESVLPRLLLADVFLSSGVAADRERAAELLDEAAERTARWPAPYEGEYARQLLEADPAVMMRLRDKLERAATEM